MIGDLDDVLDGAIGIDEGEAEASHFIGGFLGRRDETKEHRLQGGARVAALDAVLGKQCENSGCLLKGEAGEIGDGGDVREAEGEAIDGSGGGDRCSGKGVGNGGGVAGLQLEGPHLLGDDLGSSGKLHALGGRELHGRNECAGFLLSGRDACLREGEHGLRGLIRGEDGALAEIESNLREMADG